MPDINLIEALVCRYEQKKISRRELVSSLIATAATISASKSFSQTPPPVSIGRSMNHVSLSVSDVDRSANFYEKVLGLNVISRPANGGINMGLGDESFLGLYNLSNPGSMHHLCSGVENYDPEILVDKLQEHRVSATVNRNPANRTSGGDQLYFSDPDGILVQIAEHGYLG